MTDSAILPVTGYQRLKPNAKEFGIFTAARIATPVLLSEG